VVRGGAAALCALCVTAAIAAAAPQASAVVREAGRIAPAGAAGQQDPSGPALADPAGPGLAGGTPTRLVVPDVIASAPGGVSPAALAKIRALPGVRAVLTVGGARISVNGMPMTVLDAGSNSTGSNSAGSDSAGAAALRAWMPPATASSARLWAAFARGDLLTTPQAASAAHLASGHGYPVDAAIHATVADGGAAQFGIAGVDGVVDQAAGEKLGLAPDGAVLVNAPAVPAAELAAQVQAALGHGSRAVALASAPLTPGAVPAHLPVDKTPSAGRPSSYLQLFQESAADYCPGLSWTVLAAIGQIESADGQNVGPSTAGALGPMQFLPSTWAVWGTDGYGDTGAPDIMNPFDAVPSAARLLCADGAAHGTAGLRQAIFDYNHATWYVDEVLALAAEYAREY
jgi:hypothetical protein